MIKTPVSVKSGSDIVDAEGRYVCTSGVPIRGACVTTESSEIAHQIAAALNGPAEGSFEWAVKQLESGAVVKSNDLYLKIVNGVLFASIDESEPWTCACITREIINRTDWRKAVV